VETVSVILGFEDTEYEDSVLFYEELAWNGTVRYELVGFY
jgi:hypothetical protein